MIQLTPRRLPGETNFLIEPLVLIPIFTRGVLWGVVLIVKPGVQSDWSDEQRSALKMIVDVIGAVITKAAPLAPPETKSDRIGQILDRVKGAFWSSTVMAR